MAPRRRVEVGEAIAATLTGPLSNLGGAGRGLGANAEAGGHGLPRGVRRPARRPADGIVHGRSATQLTYDFSRALAKPWRAGDEVVVDPARPRLQRATLGAGGRGARPRGALDRLRPRDRREVAVGQRRGGDHRPHPARRRHRRLEPARHQAAGAADRRRGPRRGRPGVGRRRPLRGARARRPRRAGRGLVRVLAVQVPRPALRRARRRARAARDPPPRQAPARPPTRCRSGSSSAPCPTRLLAGATAAVDFLAGIAPGTAAGSRRDRLRAALHAVDAHELRLRQRLEDGLAGTGRPGGAALAGRRPHARRCCSTMPGRQDLGRLRSSSPPATCSHRRAASTPTSRSAASALDDTHGLRLGLAPYVDDDDVDRVLEGIGAFLQS